MFRSIVEDEDLFPVFVSIGYDVYGLSEPLYWTDGMTIFPDGRIEHEDDLEDMLNELRRSKSAERRSSESSGYGNDDEGTMGRGDFIDSDEDLDFSESIVGEKVLEFCEENRLALDLVNFINLGLVGLLDTIDPEIVKESTLIDAAIDTGRFAAKQIEKSYDFSEDVTDSVTDMELFDAVVAEYPQSMTALTKQVLGIPLERKELKEGLGSAYSFINTYNPSLPDTVKTIRSMTGLRGEDLARASIRLKCGKIMYNTLPEAAVLSALSFRDGYK